MSQAASRCWLAEGVADLLEGQWAMQPVPNLCQGIAMEPAAISTKFCWFCSEMVPRVSV